MIGPSLPFCDYLHFTKYRDTMAKETFEQFSHRFVNTLSEGERHRVAMLDIVQNMRFMAAGRVQAWAGSSKVVTPYNCYVSPTIHDSFVDGPKPGEDMTSVSIMDAAKYAAQTMRQGGGLGYSFSTLRPSGDMINGVQSKTDGPIAFMPVFNAVCKATSSAGNRRGAQMGTLRCDHPDIMRFITMKSNNDFLNGFNVSVLVTDELMEAVARNGSFDLRFNGRVYETVDARELWDLIMRTNWDWAEPGVLFVDTINRMNNLYYCETIMATNPCGEQPLPPWGACLLGSFNTVKYLYKDLLGGYQFDWEQLMADIPHVVHTMDNVIDKAKYPLPQQEVEAVSKRRMGLGIMGLANAGEAMGMPYGSDAFLIFEKKLLRTLRDGAYAASINLAREKGSFPLFDADKYMAGEFVKTLPEDIQWGIQKYGIRNSHLLSIAPTGTISFTADNVSSSIEPPFALKMERVVKMPEGDTTVEVTDYGKLFLGVDGKTTANVTVDEHMNVAIVAANHVDSAVSKTVNVDSHISWDDFKGIYSRAFEGGMKGCTTFNKDGKRFGLLTDLDKSGIKADDDDTTRVYTEGESCSFDPKTGRRSCE